MLACHVVFSMLLWLYMRCRSALFCNGAAPQCGWAGLMLKLCVGWREKRASSIACLAPVFSCRIVLIKKCTIRRVLIAQNRKIITCNLSHPLSQSTSSTEQHSLTRLRSLSRENKARCTLCGYTCEIRPTRSVFWVTSCVTSLKAFLTVITATIYSLMIRVMIPSFISDNFIHVGPNGAH